MFESFLEQKGKKNGQNSSPLKGTLGKNFCCTFFLAFLHQKKTFLVKILSGLGDLTGRHPIGPLGTHFCNVVLA